MLSSTFPKGKCSNSVGVLLNGATLYEFKSLTFFLCEGPIDCELNDFHLDIGITIIMFTDSKITVLRGEKNNNINRMIELLLESFGYIGITSSTYLGYMNNVVRTS
jgi:hypothetical protein